MTSIARHQSRPHAYEAPWAKYATARRPGWTWTPPVRQRFRPFETVGEKMILATCCTLMLALVVFMAR